MSIVKQIPNFIRMKLLKADHVRIIGPEDENILMLSINKQYMLTLKKVFYEREQTNY
jgi:hypothetical protein